jgi:hypothetical protein
VDFFITLQQIYDSAVNPRDVVILYITSHGASSCTLLVSRDIVQL